MKSGSFAEAARKRNAKAAGRRKPTSRDAPTRIAGLECSNVIIPDINDGAWSFIDQQLAEGKYYTFL